MIQKNGVSKQNIKTFFLIIFQEELFHLIYSKILIIIIRKNLQEYGRFHRRYLEFLNLTEKELDFFLKGLVHINAIAEIKNEEYTLCLVLFHIVIRNPSA